MIIDIHTHLIDYEAEMSETLKTDIERCMPVNKWKYTQEDFERATQAADRVFVFGIRAQATGWLSDNGRIADFAKTSARYVFVASIDPLDADFMEQLAHAHGTLGAKMIKLGPIYQGLHPHDEKYHQIYAYCQRHNLPIITHMATTFSSGVPLAYARPALMDEVSCLYPDLKIVMAHLGHPWEGEAIAAIRKQPNLYADMSALHYRTWQFYNTMRLLEEYGAQDKVFFGSDYPALTTQQAIDGLRGVNGILAGTALPAVSQEVIEGIIHRNPLEVLKI